MLDIGTLAPVDTAVLEVAHPVTGEVLREADGVAVTVTLAGADSEVYRKAARANQNRRLEAMARGRSAKLTSEQLEAEATEVLVACTVAWHGIGLDGVDLDCTPATARKLYADPRMRWLREQVDAFIAERAHFAPPSSTN